MKSGAAFMQALDDPDYQPTGKGGKKIQEIYNPEDDKSLLRLIERIEETGKATLREKLGGFGDPNGYISQS
jgi:hypothetical protein